MAFRVDDIENAVEEIERLGRRLITPPYGFKPQIEYVARTGDQKQRGAARPIGRSQWKIAVFADPDGIVLELVER